MQDRYIDNIGTTARFREMTASEKGDVAVISSSCLFVPRTLRLPEALN